MAVQVVTVIKDDLPGLKRTEASICSQSMKVSWIVVTPSGPSITHDYIDKLMHNGIVKKIEPDSGSGVYPAMNQAIELVKANDWIWYLNAGDEFASEKSYELVSIHATNSSHRWMYGGHLLGSSGGKILGEVAPPEKFHTPNQLFSKKYISHQSTIFQAKFLRELGGFSSHLKIAADWDLMARAARIDPGMRISETLSIFYMGGLSTAERNTANRELFEIRKIHLGKKYAKKNYWWFVYRYTRNNLVQFCEKKFPRMADAVRSTRLNFKI
jgi:hypothetical protein